MLVRSRLRWLLIRGRLLRLLVRSRLRSNRLLPHRVMFLLAVSLRLFLVTAVSRLDFFELVRNVALVMLLLAIRSAVLVFLREIYGR